jgi:hypothetical protein
MFNIRFSLSNLDSITLPSKRTSAYCLNLGFNRFLGILGVEISDVIKEIVY